MQERFFILKDIRPLQVIAFRKWSYLQFFKPDPKKTLSVCEEYILQGCLL